LFYHQTRVEQSEAFFHLSFVSSYYGARS
jgi:hypothetical protein